MSTGVYIDGERKILTQGFNNSFPRTGGFEVNVDDTPNKGTLVTVISSLDYKEIRLGEGQSGLQNYVLVDSHKVTAVWRRDIHPDVLRRMTVMAGFAGFIAGNVISFIAATSGAADLRPINIIPCAPSCCEIGLMAGAVTASIPWLAERIGYARTFPRGLS